MLESLYQQLEEVDTAFECHKSDPAFLNTCFSIVELGWKPEYNQQANLAAFKPKNPLIDIFTHYELFRLLFQTYYFINGDGAHVDTERLITLAYQLDEEFKHARPDFKEKFWATEMIKNPKSDIVCLLGMFATLQYLTDAKPYLTALMVLVVSVISLSNSNPKKLKKQSVIYQHAQALNFFDNKPPRHRKAINALMDEITRPVANCLNLLLQWRSGMLRK